VSINSQEVLYIRSLAVLLRSGLSVASEAITYMFPLRQGGNGSTVDVTPMDLNLDIPPLRLHDTYQVLHFTVQRCTVLHRTVLCYAVLCCTVPLCTVLCCTALRLFFSALVCNKL
jgi:hypothetical protein